MDDSAIRKDLERLDRKRLVGLLIELADFKKDNGVWLRSKMYGPAELLNSIDFYKKMISASFKGTVNLRNARTAINDYKRVSGDPDGLIELMIFYVEEGTNYTIRYGDLWSEFYTSMENTYIAVLGLLAKPENRRIAGRFGGRLKALVTKTDDIGWGYHDTLSDYYEEYIHNRAKD